jgi:hexokinase
MSYLITCFLPDVKLALFGGHSLFEFYPNFEQRLRQSLRILVGPEVEKQVKIGRAKDGSGVGGKSLGFICQTELDLTCPDH